MYIAPIGEIGLVQNVYYKGDLSYKHTALFPTQIEQKTYFDNVSKRYSNYQYNKERNVFIIGDTIANVSKYSYMWFNNASQGSTVFENKRYYAFITSVKLVNNNATEITFTVDVMQTFMFDITVPPCMVEREHTITDNLFEHIIPEDIKVDELITSKEYDYFAGRMLCGLILKDGVYDTGDNRVKLNPTFAPPFLETITENAVSGIANTLFWYCGIPTTTADVEYYRSLIAPTILETQPLYLYDRDGNIIPHSQPSYCTIGWIITKIVEGSFKKIVGGEYVDTSEDDIVGVFMYPDYCARIDYINNANEYNYKTGTIARDIEINELPIFKRLNSPREYVPKNKKLYTYPYSCIEAYNNQSQSGLYKLENFYNAENNGYKFRLIANYTNPPMIVLVPIDYEGDEFSYEKSITITGFPTPYFQGDALNRYLQQNENKRQTSLLCSAISGSLGVAISASTGNPIPALYSVAGAINTVSQQEAQVNDLRNTPAQSYATFNTDFFNLSLNRLGFVIKLKCVKYEQAKMIDDYFSINGYKINEIKRPNVFEYLIFNSTRIRPEYNYVKTRNALVKIDLSPTMCDSETLTNIANILNNGITFWRNLQNMGDYSVNNSPQV